MKEKTIAVWVRNYHDEIEVELFETLDEAIDDYVYFRYCLGYENELLAIEDRTQVFDINAITLRIGVRSEHLTEIAAAQRAKMPIFTYRVEAQVPSGDGDGEWIRIATTRTYEEAVRRGEPHAGILGESRIRIVNIRTGKVEE